jgi:hypothetical protein
VQVLQHEQQAAARRGQPPQQLQHGLPAYRGRIVAAHALSVVLALRGVQGRDYRSQRRPPRSQGVVGRVGATAQRLQQRLGQRPVGTGAATRYRTPGQHDRTAGPRLGGQFGSQPGLADAGLSDQEHHATRPAFGRAESRPQRVGFRTAADHHRAPQVRHEISMLPRPCQRTVQSIVICTNTCSHVRGPARRAPAALDLAPRLGTRTRIYPDARQPGPCRR